MSKLSLYRSQRLSHLLSSLDNITRPWNLQEPDVSIVCHSTINIHYVVLAVNRRSYTEKDDLIGDH